MPHLAVLENGRSGSCLPTHDGHYALIGCTVSHGYHEFKVSDGYPAGVLAVVVESFGAVRGGGQASLGPVKMRMAAVGNDHGAEYATFFEGDALFALPASEVQDARAAYRLTSVSVAGGAACLGVLALEDGGGDAADFVWVYELGYFVTGRRTELDGRSQIVVERHGECTAGLLVRELHGMALQSSARKT